MRRISAIVVLALCAVTAEAQAPRDTSACAQLFAAPTRDSVSTRIGLHVFAPEANVELPSDYGAFLADAIRGYLRVPPGIRLNAFAKVDTAVARPPRRRFELPPDTFTVTVAPAIAGAYAMTVLPDGRALDVRVIGGTRVDAFDSAFVAALRTISDSALMPPVFRDGVPRAIELRLGIQPMDLGGLNRLRVTGYTLDPLFTMRSPVLHHVLEPRPLAGNRPPRYPQRARERGMEGGALMQFVIQPNGSVDLGSIEVLHATDDVFADAVLRVLPSFRFAPFRAGGCALPSLVVMPFDFTLHG